jgi:hypothetical protein
MGLLSGAMRALGGGMRRGAGVADNMMAGADNMAMGGAGAMRPPVQMSPQGEAFVQRLRQRVMELQQEPFLPPRLRNELNENVDLIRRIESGEQPLG